MFSFLYLIKKSNIASFIFFLLLILFLYYPSRYAGFVTDFTGWQKSYEAGSFIDIINCFGYNGLHQFLHLVFYSLFKILGRDTIGWYILFSVLHAGIASFMYYVFTQIFKDFNLANANAISFFAAILFLLSPYQTEVLVWRVCIHYIIMAYCFLLCLWNVHLWLQSNNLKYLLMSNFIFVIALFTLELSLSIPIFLLFYVLIYSLHFKKLNSLFKVFLKVLLPKILAIASWFSLNKFFLGTLVGHYGTEKHFNTDLTLIFGNAFKYLSKHFFFQRYWSHNYKMQFWQFFENPIFLYSLVIIATILFLLALVYFKKLNVSVRLMGLMLLLFFIALLPIVNLYFYGLQLTENDRYGYVASIFCSLLIAIFIFQLPKPIKILGIGVLVFCSVFFTYNTNILWQEANFVHKSIIEKFRFYNADNIIVLNVPENFNGVPIMYSTEDEYFSTIKETLPLMGFKPYNGNIMEAAYFNITSVNDGVSVEKLGENYLKVDCNQWGTWFWRKGIGASNYENELYKIKFGVKHYDMFLKQPLPNYLFIFWNGNDWEKVSF